MSNVASRVSIVTAVALGCLFMLSVLSPHM
jgi:hypothetical protein